MVEFPLNITRNWGWKLYIFGCDGFSAATRLRSTSQSRSHTKNVCWDRQTTAAPYWNVIGINVFDEFINRLTTRDSNSTVFNPYSDKRVVNNLKLYFEYMLNNQDEHVLLIGEAPGYAGCRITGIPFTSGVTITNSSLPIFASIKSELFLNTIESEKTATIVWEYLENRGKLPVFWNSFPFHPHDKEDRLSNRAPTDDEIEEGKYYIESLIEIFKPKVIAAIGRKGEKALNNIFPDKHIEYIRHPSRGGKSEFLAGIDNIL